MTVHIKSGAPEEIDIPAEERDHLVKYPHDSRPPPPAALEPAVKRMYDCIAHLIFIPFCNYVKVREHDQFTVVVTNMADQVTESSLRDSFLNLGMLLNPQILEYRLLSGLVRHGIVEFRSENDRRNAVSTMDRQLLEGKQINCISTGSMSRNMIEMAGHEVQSEFAYSLGQLECLLTPEPPQIFQEQLTS